MGRRGGGRAVGWAGGQTGRRLSGGGAKENEEKADVAKQIRCWWSIAHSSNKADPLWPQMHWSWKWKEAPKINEAQQWRQQPGYSSSDLFRLHCMCNFMSEIPPQLQDGGWGPTGKCAKYIWLDDRFDFCDSGIIFSRPATATDKLSQPRMFHRCSDFIHCRKKNPTQPQTLPIY